MFDNICKFLAESFPADFATWLLGESTPLTQLSPTELSLEPIRADALILLQSDNLILHIEFQTHPSAEIPFRMADYRLRLYRRFPDKQVYQVVIYLKHTQSDLVRQTAFELPELRHEFRVIRLWEQPTEVFLQTPGLLPFAVLSQTETPEITLNQVATAIAELAEPQVQQNVAAASSILAGLVLERELIEIVLRRELMRESVIYQSILQEGRQEGRQEGERSLILVLLRQKVGSLPDAMADRIALLSVEQLDGLAIALLDFSALRDLDAWLDAHQ
jgi:predicted transposase/invertase (TIGR01784 family)